MGGKGRPDGLLPHVDGETAIPYLPLPAGERGGVRGATGVTPSVTGVWYRVGAEDERAFGGGSGWRAKASVETLKWRNNG